MNRVLGAQFLTFAACGVAGTAVHYLLLVLLVQLGIAQPTLATTIGFAGGALINYALAWRIVFKTRRPHHEALPRFLAVAGSGAVLNYLVMATGVAQLGWPYLAVQVAATGLVLIWNFAVNRAWTFAAPRHQ